MRLPGAKHTRLMTTSPPPRIILDLTRLLSRVTHATPTGVDRVEMAYARGLMELVPRQMSFAAIQPYTGIYGRLPAGPVLRFLDATEQRWANERNIGRTEMRRRAMRHFLQLWPNPLVVGRGDGPAIYLKAAPNNLTEPAKIARIRQRERAKFVCLVHDLIPLQYPEYARADGALKHARRIDTVVGQADGVIANSHATLAALAPYIAASGRAPLTTVAHLGTEPAIAQGKPTPARPYFVCIGTIESRKNHLLLLHLWRQMAERRGRDAIPQLMVIGRRGWENEQVVDLLDRSPALVGCVRELRGLPDQDVQRLLAGSRGLLLPSFAEGYGMPVSEALAHGVPVVCSDLPALREAGGDVPEYLDPLDGPAWERAILDLAEPDSVIAPRQATRRRDWRAPTWREHLAIVLELLHRVSI